MPRRAGFIRKFVSEQPNTVIVDSGDLAYVKDQLIQVLGAYSMMGYTAVGLGQADVRMGKDFWTVAKDKKVPVVQIDSETHDCDQPYLIKDVDGVKVGIISFGAVPPQNESFDLLKKRYAMYAEARQKSDVLILLDQAQVVTADWINRNGKRFGAPDIVIGGTNAIALGVPKNVGKTMIVPTSTQGSTVGVVKVKFTKGQDPEYSFEKVTIDDKVPEDKDVAKMLSDYQAQKAKQFQPPVRQPVQGARTNGTTPPTLVSASPGPPYYRSENCKTCHASQYESWQKTKHAQALQTLIAKSQAIPECLKCHSEMFRKTSRLTLAAGRPAGVECASCHLSVLPHGANYKKRDVKVDQQVCLTCHTKEKSEDFNFQTYVEKIKHS